MAKSPSFKSISSGQDLNGRGLGSGIRVPKTAEVLADHIRSQIIRGELQEGDFLPPESQLMTTLNISRPTLREAFRILEAENLISVVRGSRSGARVHVPHVASVSRYAGFVLQSQGTTIRDIYDARLAIEPYVAGVLAMRGDQEDCARLRTEIDRLTAYVDEEQYVDFMIALAGFHQLLVELGGNHTLLFLYSVLEGVVKRHQVAMLSRRPMNQNEAMRGLRSFRKLVNLIEARDAAGAEEHWQRHVSNANSDWVGPEDAKKVIDILG